MTRTSFLAFAFALQACCTLLAQDKPATDPDIAAGNELVGRSIDEVTVTPVNQRLTPMGKLTYLPGLRPQVLALTPNKKRVVVSGKTSKLVVLDADSGEIVDRVDFPNEAQITVPEVASTNILKPDTAALASYTGLVFSPDGSRLYLSNVHGSIKVFAVDVAGKITPSYSIPLPQTKAPRRKNEIPSGLAISPDGGHLYVCGNLSNQLLVIQTSDGKLVRSYDVGVAPYDVRIVAGKAFVSNWGGRRPNEGDLTGPAGRGTTVRVDPVRHIASEGSVSIVDIESGRTTELLTGLHASGLAVSPDSKYVVCANAGSDTLSVIHVGEDRLVENLWAKANPSELFGASPNAVEFDPSGERLYVANGTQNAIAVLSFEPEERGDSRLLGLLPVGWFPGAIALHPTEKTLYVANIKGLPLEPKKQGAGLGFNSHQYTGSFSIVPIPDDDKFGPLSERVAKNMRASAIANSKLPPRPGQPARPIPERIGEPSLIEHVVYIIKENRTYDQVLGDIERGNGDKDLCIFGRPITPNQHKIAEDFVLLDNTYCCGILSADGHQWSTQAIATDYLEKSFAGFPRSYPDGMGDDEADALSYSPAGFIWDNAVKKGIRIRNYGEFMKPHVRWREPKDKGPLNFMSCYNSWANADGQIVFGCKPAIESIKDFSPTEYVGWDMSVPDQFRADFILRELKEFEAAGNYPQMTIVCLPNDHTSGTSKNCPTPAACMADNDLAVGRIVEGLSHSKFWPKMAVFIIEDDPQAGWDHVSGYRTTAYCASPFAKRGVTISTQYNTNSILRTMEQILGLPPMNQFDAGATPMFDCFQDIADTSAYEALPSAVPLDQMNPNSAAIVDELQRWLAEQSDQMNFEQIDRAPEDLLNRVLWHAMKGSQTPYPEWATIAELEDDDDDEDEDAESRPTESNIGS